MKWRKVTTGGVTTYERGTYRIVRHEVDDTWDTGALVPFSVQWVREERMPDGSWNPVELHLKLSDAKQAAERWEARIAVRDPLHRGIQPS